MKDLAIKNIINKALDGGRISKEEAAKLFSIEIFSEEFFLLLYASRRISEQACGGLAEVHGQVGLNVGLCPKNCRFCSFAAINGIFNENRILSLEEVVENCIDLERSGANAVYLMSTANFEFSKFLETGKVVREHLKKETVLIANTGDMDYQQALALKEAGFEGVYHAIRLGEGKDTLLDVKKRFKTFEAVREAGLVLGTCVEPVGPEHSIEELVEKTWITIEAKPAYSGAARRIPIPGTEMGKLGKVSEAKMAQILAAVRVATGYDIPGNCTHEPNVIGAASGASLLWAETGSNPRDVSEKTEDNRGYSVERCRELFEEAGWQVLNGPSVMYRSSH